MKSLSFDARKPLKIILDEWCSGAKPDPVFQRNIAAHEAGHALIASLCNVKPLGAIVYGEGNSEGAYGEVFLDPADFHPLNARDRFSILCAGAIATAVVGAEHPNDGMYFGAASDMEAIHEIIDVCGYDQDEVRAIAQEVTSCLRAFKAELLKLTEALVSYRFISADEIRMIVAVA